MNRSVVLMFMCGLLMGAHSQDPLRRMDPDDWFKLEEVQEAWTILKESSTVYGANIWFSSGSLEMVGGSQGEAFGRVDDMRLIIDADGQSIGRSHNHGFNLGARQFFHRNRRYAVGGRGFWNAHSLLVEFIPSTGEWELQPCADVPEHVMGALTWYDALTETVVAIDPMDTDLPIEDKCRVIHRLSMDSLNWTELGTVNKSLDVHFRDRATITFDLPGHVVWLGLHKSVILRKRDLVAVVTPEFNRSSLRSKRDFGGGVGYLLTTVDSTTVRIVQKENVTDSGWTIVELDVVAAFEAMEDEALNFVVTRHHHEVADEQAAQSALPWGLLSMAALVLAGAGFFVGRLAQLGGAASNHTVAKPMKVGDGESGSLDNFSVLTSRFIRGGARELDTAELNAFLGLDMEQSEETIRARRAQCIRDVNKEYKLVFGVDLIFRKKDEVDRRRTTYVIQPYSGSA